MYPYSYISWCIRIKYKNQDSRAAKKLGNKSYSKVNSVRKHSFGTNGSNFQADHKLWEKKNEKTSSKPSELYITPGRLKLLTTPLSAGVRGPGTQHTPMSGSEREQRCWLEAPQEAAAHQQTVFLLSVIKNNVHKETRGKGILTLVKVILAKQDCTSQESRLIKRPIHPNLKRQISESLK